MSDITIEEIKENMEANYKILGTRNPTIEEYAEIVFRKSE